MLIDIAAISVWRFHPNRSGQLKGLRIPVTNDHPSCRLSQNLSSVPGGFAHRAYGLAYLSQYTLNVATHSTLPTSAEVPREPDTVQLCYMRHSHVVVAHVWQHNRPATTFKDVVSIILVVGVLLAFKREAQCRHFATTLAAGAGSSGYPLIA